MAATSPTYVRKAHTCPDCENICPRCGLGGGRHGFVCYNDSMATWIATPPVYDRPGGNTQGGTGPVMVSAGTEEEARQQAAAMLGVSAESIRLEPYRGT